MGQSSGRLSEIVKALKTYVYLDQGPVQEVSVQEGLDNTLVILRHKIKQGIEVRREYDPNLPRIQAYGSELNQVWTNILDNAIDAAGGKGRLVLRTRFADPWVVVDIEDNGPGISLEDQNKLFSPFFTTKPMGKGTGLGLNISYNIIHRHGGEIKVKSQPGETHFEVWLPVDLHQSPAAISSPQTVLANDDSRLRRILEETRTIAVVGITDKPEKTNYSVPAYLQQHGYRIIPVNPRLGEVLGEKAYPDLLAIPRTAEVLGDSGGLRPVDVVLIYRAAEFVQEIVDQAIEIGAKVVWMPEGITNEAAAQKAGQAGIEVVMDTCMRKTHQRIFGEKA
jgi:predicted CoA-binding protein